MWDDYSTQKFNEKDKEKEEEIFEISSELNKLKDELKYKVGRI